MKRKARSVSAAGKSRRAKDAPAASKLVVPLNDAMIEILSRVPDAFGNADTDAKEGFLMLAAYEGMLAMAEHFEAIQSKRRVVRSDLLLRFEIKTGVVGRAAKAEQDARTIDALLEAATRSADV